MPADPHTPWTAATLEELVAGTTDRTDVRTSDAKPGARFERLVSDGQRTSSRCSPARTTGSCGSPATPPTGSSRPGRPACTTTPPVIDHTILGMALERTGRTPGLSILMATAPTDLVPPGDAVISPGHHRASLTTWRPCTPTSSAGATTSGCRTRPTASCSSPPRTSPPSSTSRDVPVPIAVARRGLGAAPERAPRLHELAARSTVIRPRWLRQCGDPADVRGRGLEVGQPRPAPRRPHGAARLGLPGRGRADGELTWYLALNRARLPETKE